MKTSKPKFSDIKKRADGWTPDSSYQTTSSRIPQLRVETAKQANIKNKPVEEIHVPVREDLSPVKSLLSDIDSHGTYVKGKTLKNQSPIPKGSKKEEPSKHHSFDCEQKSALETVTQIKLNWQKTIAKYDKMKKELGEKQVQFTKTYAALRSMHAKLKTYGHHVELPLNDALPLPGPAHQPPGRDGSGWGEMKEFNMGVQNFLNLPTQLLSTCEMAINKRNHIIDWLQCQTTEKDIRQKNFAKRINEFKQEGKSLQAALEGCKSLYVEEFNEITEFLRNSIAETNILQSQTKHLETQLTELKSENELLTKQIDGKIMNSQVEVLQEELRSRAAKAQERAAEAEKHAAQLELDLEDSHSTTCKLEEQVWNLQHQRDEFNSAKAALEESLRMKQNQLDKLTNNHETLQAEKKELEKRLEELSKLLSELNEQSSSKLAKLEEKCKSEDEHLKELLARLADKELECKEMKDQLKSVESMCKDLSNEIGNYKTKLSRANEKIAKSEMEVTHLNETMQSREDNYHKLMIEKALIMEQLQMKEDNIMNLNGKQADLHRKLLDSERKMESYESQISSLKDHVDQLKREFGEIQNLSELNELIEQQRTNLKELRKQNEELTVKLTKQETEIESHKNAINDQNLLIRKKEEIIQKLKENDEAHSSNIELLRMKLEKKPHMDPELVAQLRKKEAETETLHKRLHIEKQRVCQLEKIILTFEEGAKRHIPKEIPLKNNQSSDPAAKHAAMIPENLDALIRILENELESPMPSTVAQKENDPNKPRAKLNALQRPGIDTGTISFISDQQEGKGNLVYSCSVPKKTYSPKFNCNTHKCHDQLFVRHCMQEDRPSNIEGMYDDAYTKPRKVSCVSANRDGKSSCVSANRDEKRPRIRMVAGNSRMNAML